ncbi:uncharacterized protein KY384_001348 [Bacidia gigantensis]|uniref:uncharacterized protein n=1 Tax=Bacidia gigantensis TaxID=2732470 RepID=UPI001D05A788|nr:uncharacterized protein KY384_001348 [Bacidia gigantensis]KAG8533608.1 hypothetical protein KY384_001348 [Bacidia gigantensis]
MSVKQTICLISGANQGIGYETAKNLASSQQHWHILIGTRDLAKGEQAASMILSALSLHEGKTVNEVSAVQLDVTSDESIANCVAYIKGTFGRLDVLINNAGISGAQIPHAVMPREKFGLTADTNAFGAAALTEACEPLLSASTNSPARIVFVSSEMGSIDNALNPSFKFYDLSPRIMQYKASKAAMNMVAACFAVKYKDRGWKVNITCPGLRATNFTSGPNAASKAFNGGTADEGALNAVRLATLGEDGETGTFSNIEGPMPCWKQYLEMKCLVPRFGALFAICAALLFGNVAGYRYVDRLKPRQNEDVVPTAQQYLRRRLHSAIVAGKYLYIDGGSISFNESNGEPAVVAQQNSTLSIDLSKDWDNSTVDLIKTSKPSDMPVFNLGALWYHKTEDLIYAGLVGGTSGPTPLPSLWTFKPDQKGSGTWSQAERGGSSALQAVEGLSRGPTAQGPDSAWALNPQDSSNNLLPGMIQLDMGTERIQKLNTAAAFSVLGDEASLQYVPMWGRKGLLVAFGGSVTNDDKYPDNSIVPVFDVDTQQWYSQTTSGDIPAWRNWVCTAGVKSTRDTFEIFYYGGFVKDGEAAVQNDDIHILSLPAFNWIKVPYEAQHPRGGHTCTPVGGSQILVVGGDDPSVPPVGRQPDDATNKMLTKDIWRQGIAVFDMSALAWKANYTSGLNDTYMQSNNVTQYYVTNGRSPKNAPDPHIADLLNSGNSVNVSSTATNSTSPRASAPSKPSRTISVGTIVGVIVGGVAGIVLIAALILFLYRSHLRTIAQTKVASNAKWFKDVSEYGSGSGGSPATDRRWFAQSPINSEPIEMSDRETPALSVRGCMRCLLVHLGGHGDKSVLLHVIYTSGIFLMIVTTSQS